MSARGFLQLSNLRSCPLSLYLDAGKVYQRNEIEPDRRLAVIVKNMLIPLLRNAKITH